MRLSGDRSSDWLGCTGLGDLCGVRTSKTARRIRPGMLGGRGFWCVYVRSEEPGEPPAMAEVTNMITSMHLITMVNGFGGFL